MQQASLAESPDLRSRQRRAVRNVIFSCVAVLLVGQLLIAALSLAALLRLGTESAVDRLSLIAGRSAGQVQAGLQLGKPITQYFGLSLIFERLQQDIPDLQAAAVVLDDGTVLAATGSFINGETLLRELARGLPRASDSGGGVLKLALPLAEPDGGRKGALLIQVSKTGLPEGTTLQDNLRFLAIVTLIAALVMALAVRQLPVHSIAAAGWLRMAVPVVIMLAAQGVYTVHTVKDFRDIWQAVIQQNAHIIGEGLEKDLEKVLGYGIELERMKGVEQPMLRAMQAFPLLGGMRLLAGDGSVVAKAGNVDAGPVILSFPLEAGAAGPTIGALELHSDDGAMRKAVRARALDAATIAVVAMVAAIELMLMLQVLMDRAFSARRAGVKTGAAHALIEPAVGAHAVRAEPSAVNPSRPDDPSRLGMVARPVMFAFLFAMALPLGFLPLYARSLLGPGWDDGMAAMLVALPTAAEMGAGLATALLAGRLIDRRGWLAPSAWGMGLALAGNLACAFADTLWTLSAARALAGLGYGLVWMALQGFVVNLGQARYRGRNMTVLIAGLFAGHMTGAAVGGMMASQLGPRPVFLVGALMVIGAALALRTLLWPYRAAAPIRAAAAAPKLPVSSSGLKGLLRDKGYAVLLLGSVVPFSIAQVGLLSYALPLYFDALGASTGDVGRVIMLYGFCVIYLGPMLGRLMDGSRHWKHWIAAGGAVGASGLLLLLWAPGLWGVTSAVLLLAVASCLAGAAQTPYMLARESVQAYGAAGATGLMRGADKFGQMLGPLMVGALFAAVGMSAALVWTGVLYLLGTLLFWRLAPNDGVPQSAKE